MKIYFTATIVKVDPVRASQTLQQIPFAPCVLSTGHHVAFSEHPLRQLREITQAIHPIFFGQDNLLRLVCNLKLPLLWEYDLRELPPGGLAHSVRLIGVPNHNPNKTA